MHNDSREAGTHARGSGAPRGTWANVSPTDRVWLARAHGSFNIASGVWPLLHMRSFERVTGSKVDRWLVQTVAGLLITNGVAQIAGARSEEGRASARRVGIGTSATLAVIDLVYGARGRIRWVYLLDVPVELGWLAGWSLSKSADAQPSHAVRGPS